MSDTLENAVLQWNCQGLRSRIRDLESLIQEAKNPLMLALQETNHHRPGVKTKVKVRGYHGFYCKTEGYPPNSPNNTAGRVGPGWGSALFIRNDLQAVEVQLNTDLQVAAAKVYLLDMEWTICSIYVPGESLNAAQLNNLFAQLQRPYLVLGDFNARHPSWGDRTRNRNGNVVAGYLEAGEPVLLNGDSPTFHSAAHNEETNIDLSLCSPQEAARVDWIVRPDLNPVDHYPMFTRFLNLDPPPALPRKFLINKARWQEFEESAAINSPIEVFANATEMAEYLTSTILAAAERSIPRSSGKPRKRVVPWWNAACQAAKRDLRCASRRYHRLRTQDAKIAFKRARAKARLTYKLAQRTSFSEYATSINSHTPISTVWKKVRAIQGNYQPPRAPVLSNDNGMVFNKHDVAEVMGTTFSRVSSPANYPAEFLQRKEALESQSIDFGSLEGAFNSAYLLEELMEALKSAGNTAPGEDEISYEMLRHLPKSALVFFIQMINHIWFNHDFPQQWRSALVLPFPKPGKDPTKAGNYRPIALTSCLCKIMEKMVNKRLMYILEPHLSDYQCAFRRMRSSIDPVILLDSEIKLNFKEKQHTAAVFFDLQKAYDTTWRYGILRALRSYGVQGHMLHFVKNFLAERNFSVQLQEVRSARFEQEEGVPQGATLSCSLFLAAINGIKDILPRRVKYTLYADDLCIYTSGGRGVGHLDTRLQSAIDAVERWTAGNGFRFSSDKTVIVHFCNKRVCAKEHNLLLNGIRVKQQDQTRYLGVIMDSKNTYRQHVKDLKARCYQAMNVIKCLSHVSWGADRKILLQLFQSLVLSKLDYGCQVYGLGADNIVSMLDPVLNTGVRLSLGAFKSSRVTSLLVEAGVMPLEYRRWFLICKQYYKYKQHEWNGMAKEILGQRGRDPYHQNTFSESAGLILRHFNIFLPRMMSMGRPPCPWLDQAPTWCQDLARHCKTDTAAGVMRALFEDHVHNIHEGSPLIFTDGSKTNNKVGFAAVGDGHTISHTLNSGASIYSAELLAIVKALEIIEASNSRTGVICSDSRSALEALNSGRITNPIVLQIRNELISLRGRGYNIKFCWSPGHVGIQGNEQADAAAKGAQQRDPHLTAMPVCDFFPIIRERLWKCWQREWDENTTDKLREVKTGVHPWMNPGHSNRRVETVLARLRIGHTRLTHEHLMTNTEPRQCRRCRVVLSVKHILVECPNFNNARRRFFGGVSPPLTLQKILAEGPTFSLGNLLGFLKSIGVLSKI